MPKRRAPEAQPSEPPAAVDKVEEEIEAIPHVERDHRFDVFEGLPLVADVQRRTKNLYHPITQTTTNFVFEIPPTDVFTNVGSAKLKYKVMVQATPGAVEGPAHNADWGIVNFISNAIWKLVRLECNGETLTTTSEDMSYAAYMSTVVFEDKGSIANRKQNGFFLDTPFQHAALAGENAGNTKRKQLFQHPDEPWPRTGIPITGEGGDRAFSGRPELVTDLHDLVDFMNNPRFLIPGVKMNLTCIKKDDNFVLRGTDASRWVFTIQDIRLEVEYLQAIPSKMQNITNVLFENDKAARYPISSRVTRSFIIPAQRSAFEMYNLFENNVPNVLMFGLVNTNAKTGGRTLNPFQFDTYGLTSLLVKRGTEEVAGPRKYFNSQGDYAEAVEMMLEAVGASKTSNEKIINRENFRGGYAIFAVCLNPDGIFKPWRETTGINTGAAGVYLSLTFQRPLPHNVSLVCVGFFENQVLIDGGRNVTLENQF